MIGTTIDAKYRIDAVLGSGGYGIVLRALQIHLDRTVAIKVMRESTGDAEPLERFKREATAIARLKHPNIVTVFDFGVDAVAGAYIVMEYLEGRSLRSLVDAAGRVPVRQGVAIARQIADAAHAAHAAGIVHRDLKPENVFLEDVAGGISVKVLDFGIARLTRSADPEGPALTPLTGEVDLVGTYLYMSPEQIEGGEVDARTDVYAIGCVLYEMLTGRPPFTSRSPVAVLAKHAKDVPEAPGRRVAAVPEALDAIVLRALEKAPPDRFATAAELSAALSELAASLSGDAAFIGGGSGSIALSPSLAGTAPGAAGSSAGRGVVTRPEIPGNLPRVATSFIGRERECAAVHGALERSRLVTLTGPGGIGKTRLALAVASATRERVSGGIWFVDLAAVSDPAVVARTVATTLGVREEPDCPVAVSIAKVFAPREALIVLDNCEHVLDEAADVAATLGATCAGVRVLATSREPLGIDGEQAWAVPPLAVPDDRAEGRAPACRDLDAVRLFVDRAKLALADFAPTDDDLVTISDICRRLDGLPLAIELAAARTRLLSVAQIDERLGDRFRLLARPGTGGLDRQRTLRAAIDWSYDLLDDRERRLFARASVFAGSFSLESVEAVCPESPGEADDVLDLLESLVAKSLVSVVRRGSSSRFRLLESIRQYAAEKLADIGDADALRGRHLDYYRGLVADTHERLGGPDAAAWGARLDDEAENVRLALGEAAAHTDGGAAQFEMAMALWRYWYQHGHLAEGREWMEAAIARAAPVIGESERAMALGRLGSLATDQGDIDAAVRFHGEALEINRRLDNRRGIAVALHNLSNIRMLRGELPAAASLCEESYAILEELGDEDRLGLSLLNRGTIALIRGDLETADAHLDAAMQTFLRRGNAYGESLVLEARCEMALRKGEFGRLTALLDETTGLSARIDNRHNLAAMLKLRGIVARRAGETGTAIACGEQALVHFREMGDRQCAIEVLGNLADADMDEGDLTRAYARVCEAVSLAERTGFRRHLAGCLDRAAAVALAWGDVERAAEIAGHVEAIREELDAPVAPVDRPALDALRSAVAAHGSAVTRGRAAETGAVVRSALSIVRGVP